MDPFSLIALGQAAGSVLGGIFGSNASNKAAKQAAAAQQLGLSRYNAGADAAEGAINSGTTAAMSHITPYSDAGRNALTLYQNAVGANGQSAQQSYYNNFMDDPGFAGGEAAGLAAIEHSRIARGTANSGGAARELFAFGENARLGAYRDRLSQLSGLAGMGMQADNTAASLESGRGSALAQTWLGRGTAGQQAAIGTGNANAANSLQQGNLLTNMAQGMASAGTIWSATLDGGNALRTVAGARYPNALPMFYGANQPIASATPGGATVNPATGFYPSSVSLGAPGMY